MSNLKFRHFAGGCDYKNMNVAVYNDTSDTDLRVMIAESSGDELCRKTIMADEYAELREQWSNDGKLSEDDVRITVAALEWVGAFDERSGYLGNKNAHKNESDKASSFIHARCLPGDKARWVKAAQANNKKLTEWIIETLNQAVNS